MSKYVKQVIVIPRILNMSPGKLVAQGSHASLNAYLAAEKIHPAAVDQWWNEGITKIVLAIPDQAALLALYDKLDLMGYGPALIKDEGLTEVAPGTYTAMAVGPIYSEMIDPYTRQLPLYK